MKHPKELKIQDYTYDLPDERIAKYPLEVRDASKLLVYKNGLITETNYSGIAAEIRKDSLLVFNQTKVVHARLLFKKPTRGVIEVFCLEPNAQYTDVHTAMLQTGRVLWNCMIGGASKWKHGMVLEIEHFSPDFMLSAAIVGKTNDTYVVELKWEDLSLTFAEVLHYIGKVPLPPYLHREVEKTDESRYQTIFAKDEGSVAAPTAGLHFAENVLDSLSSKGIDTVYLTLHVGAGTFKPVKSETMQEHDMHAEWIEIDQASILQLIGHLEKGIIAVGTTSLRTLESLYWIGNKLFQDIPVDFAGLGVSQWDPYEIPEKASASEALQALLSWMRSNDRSKLVTRTQILIAPGYTFHIIKGLVTNFHQPQSTLLLLVAALIGDDWRKVYNYALGHQYRFLSYGDGCLLWAK